VPTGVPGNARRDTHLQRLTELRNDASAAPAAEATVEDLTKEVS